MRAWLRYRRRLRAHAQKEYEAFIRAQGETRGECKCGRVYPHRFYDQWVEIRDCADPVGCDHV